MNEFYEYLSGLTPDAPAGQPDAVRRSEKAVIKQMGVRKMPRITRKTKLIASLTAAALAICGTVAAVSGALRYNRQLANAQFGELGAARLEQIVKPEPRTFTNGKVSATVEAVLCDGDHAMLLTTFAPAQRGEVLDWENELEISCEKGKINSDGEPCFLNAWVETNDVRYYGDQAWVSWVIKILPDGEPNVKEVTFVMNHWTEDYTASGKDSDAYSSPKQVGKAKVHDEHNSMCGGLELTFPIEQNIPVLTLRSDSGETLNLSGFELFRSGSFPHYSDGPIKLLRTNGTVSEAWLPTYGETDTTGGTVSGRHFHWSAGRFYEMIDGVKLDRRDPSTFIGFIDVRLIDGVEIGGVTYRRAE